MLMTMRKDHKNCGKLDNFCQRRQLAGWKNGQDDLQFMGIPAQREGFFLPRRPSSKTRISSFATTPPLCEIIVSVVGSSLISYYLVKIVDRNQTQGVVENSIRLL